MEFNAKAYIEYSKNAYHDEENKLAFFANGIRHRLTTAGKYDKYDEILPAQIDVQHYIETALPERDEVALEADDGSTVKVMMSLRKWSYIDQSLITWYEIDKAHAPKELETLVSESFYDMWKNHQRRAKTYKKRCPKPSAEDGIVVENRGAEYYCRAKSFPQRANTEVAYKKYAHSRGNEKLEWIAVPECVKAEELELSDFIFYEHECAINLAIEISAALADYHSLVKLYGDSEIPFYDIALFELEQRLLPSLLRSREINSRIAIARTFIYALHKLFAEQADSGWGNINLEAQYKKTEAWIAQISSSLCCLLEDKQWRPVNNDEDQLESNPPFYGIRAPIQFADRQQLSMTDKAYPKLYNYSNGGVDTPRSFAIFCNRTHPNMDFYFEIIDFYSSSIMKGNLHEVPRSRNIKMRIFSKVYRLIQEELKRHPDKNI